MKITVITNKDGKLVAASYGHQAQPNTSEVQNLAGFRAGIFAGPGQHLHVLEVSDDLNQVNSPHELHARIESELIKARK